MLTAAVIFRFRQLPGVDISSEVRKKPSELQFDRFLYHTRSPLSMHWSLVRILTLISNDLCLPLRLYVIAGCGIQMDSSYMQSHGCALDVERLSWSISALVNGKQSRVVTMTQCGLI